MTAARLIGAAALALLAGAGLAAAQVVSEGGHRAVTTADAGAGEGVAETPTPAEAAAEQAAAAAAQLRAAMGQLDRALTADDQVVALTEVIRAYEMGQAALRDGLRRASLREAQVRADFDARRDRLSRVIGVMTAMQQSPETLMLLHPAGPASTARSGMVLSAIAPALQAEADSLKSGLAEIATVRAIEQAAADTLAQGLGEVQEARRLLASAVTDRSTVPVRFGEDPAELTSLVRSAETLDSFADGIVAMEQDIGAPMADFEAAQGNLQLPVLGQVVPGRDGAGARLPGLTIATQPAALVTTPWPATIRYRGPLLDYGNVMIVEPARDYLLVVAGLAQVFGETGDVLAQGEPLGLMGGNEGPAAEFGAGFVAAATGAAPPDDAPRLYLELRHGKETLDPTEWFVMNPVITADAAAAGTGSDEVRTTE
ncbi:murein hydrolase activator EnvC family protein [Paracoccus luteus]|uniref:murein hydrolase activator EnvC family protein n=1 Tax=Paracoccus luteus TaxID=2508543 RepID=UPI00107004AF|nr:peptidoglycan DD-metalloendopeptidase family protein [Paracoccus luteus]